jgi:asparagine synthase (glutamine-hydrolysing)
MCGIAGVACPTRSLPEQALSMVRQFCAELIHRGPDGEGVLRRPNVVLGHRRLAVLDLSAAGQQPMSDEKELTWVVFNGEIYNHRSLRAELEAVGRRFRSRSDTEALVHGYEEWGMAGLLPRLRGMFAFALWDEARSCLWLVRDRLGVKPLFYHVDEGVLAFASEIRPLYEVCPPRPDLVDRTALDCFLAFGYVPPDRAILEGIHKLPPATAVEFNGSGTHSWRYWTPPQNIAPAREVPELVSKLARTIGESVAARLETDVPLGCFLSGGIDSGLVTALASSALGRPLTTLTVGFGSATPDDGEIRLARLVAKRYQTRHCELRVTGTETAALPQLVRIVGEPFADSSLLPTAAVCRAARKSLTVALTGDGGDEIFAGYAHVAASYWGDRVRRVVGGSAAGAASRLFLHGRPGGALHRLGTVFQYASNSLVDLYAEQTAVFNSRARAALYKLDWLHEETHTARDIISDHALALARLPLAEAYARLDLGFRLPGRYLVKLDVASSAHSLECRSPFLDQYLVESALRLPAATLLRGGRQKGLLRSFAAHYLPKSVVRARKRGFGPAVDAWLRADGKRLLEQLRPFAIGGHDGPLQAEPLDHLLSAHLAGAGGLGDQVWSLLCLELWWRTFVKREPNPATPRGAD